MLQKIYITAFLCLAVNVVFAQKTDRDYLRSGNKLYNDSLFIKAEVDYRKALEINPKSTDAMFNLGNALLMQQKAKEAMEQYESVSKIEKDKSKLAQIYHNMGVILQSSKQYPQCIEAYKESLRNNPKDDETRYNLALAQKLLKDQQQPRPTTAAATRTAAGSAGTEQGPARTRSEGSTTAATAKQQERNVERKCSTTAECGHARRKECTRQSKETDTNPRKEIGKRLVIA